MLPSSSLLWFPRTFHVENQPCRPSPQTQCTGYSIRSIWRLPRRHIKNEALSMKTEGDRGLKNVPVYEAER